MMCAGKANVCCKQISFCAAAMLCLLSAATALAESKLEQLYHKIEPTVVEVLVDGQHGGSGNFVTEDGLVLTASHIFVMMGMKGNIEVLSPEFGRLKANLVELDKGHDLALLQIADAGERKFPFLEVTSRNPPVGADLFSVSAPLYIHNSFNRSFVAADSVNYRKMSYCDGYVEVLYIATLSPKGSSGGSWVNRDGKIAGVQSGWVDNLGTKDNSGFSLIAPASAISAFIETRNPPRTTWIGGTIEELWTQSKGFIDRFASGAEGLIVHAVAKGGPLEQAGVKKEWLITEIDGRPVRYQRDFMDYVRSKQPGEKISLQLLLPDEKGNRQKVVELGVLDSGK